MTKEQKEKYNALKKMISMKPQKALPKPQVKREKQRKNSYFNYLF